MGDRQGDRQGEGRQEKGRQEKGRQEVWIWETERQKTGRKEKVRKRDRRQGGRRQAQSDVGCQPSGLGRAVHTPDRGAELPQRMIGHV